MDRKSLAQKILENYQSGFPLDTRPFQLMARELNSSEEEVRLALEYLNDEGILSRVGPVFATNRVGKSFLAAIECPIERIDEVAAAVSAHPEVNHNYQRENKLSLWFVMTGADDEQLTLAVKKIEEETGLKVHRFPMVRAFKIDLTRKGEIAW